MSATTTNSYQPHIDGLRAIAILSVLFYHAGLGCPGGYVGVDVFFVISGYLISTIIFREVVGGRFSIVRFYSRRVKRIFPALTVVLLVVLGLGWLFLYGSEFRNLGMHLFGGSVFISNLLLWRETGYFAATSELKPLLHLWSLGIEEQFYIFFPLLVWLLYRARTSFIAHGLGLILAVSFALCLYGIRVAPVATFFLPITRIWELLVGCVLALMQQPPGCGLKQGFLARIQSRFGAIPFRPTLMDWISIFGMAMVMGIVFSLNSRHLFPGAWALVPTFGAAMLIASGPNAFINRKVLSSRIMVGVGLISYPLYLWHWPALYFARILSPEKPAGWTIAAAVIASLILAWLTYRFIELPIRSKGVFGARTIPVLCSAMVLLGLAGFLAMSQVVPSRLALSPLSNESDEAARDWAYPFPDNFQAASGFQKVNAGLPKATGSAVLFIGDSHMEQLWPRIELVRNKLQERSRPIFFITAGGIPTLPGVNDITPGYHDPEFYQFCLKEVAQPQVGTVVFCCNWAGYFPSTNGIDIPGLLYRVGDPRKTPLKVGDAAALGVFNEFGADIGKLVASGKQVVVVLCSPRSKKWSPLRQSRLSMVSSKIDRLPVTQEEMQSVVGPIEERIRDVVVANGGQVVNPRKLMEEGGAFYGRNVEGKYRYKDAHHMRPFYVIETASFLDDLIRAP